MKNYLLSTIEEIAGTNQYTSDQKERKLEGSIIADLVDNDVDAVPSSVWVDDNNKDGLLAIVKFDQYEGMADGDVLNIHISHSSNLCAIRWELTVYVAQDDNTSCEHAKAFTKIHGMHAKSVFYDVLGLIKATIAAAQ